MIKTAFRIPCIKQNNSKAAEGIRYISQKESLAIADMENLRTKFDIRMLQFAGHIARMGSERTRNKIRFGEYYPTEGNNFVKKKRSTYQDTLQAALARSGIQDTVSWKYKAQKKQNGDTR